MSTFTGTAGDDSILGTGAGDDFHMEQGGTDTVSGAAGIDVFYFGAGFDAGDRIDGGADRDFLVLDGDYSGAGVTLVEGSLVGVEEIDLVAGNDYRLAGLDHVHVAGLIIDGHSLGAGDAMTIEASERTQAIVVTGGAGGDFMAGSQADDTLDGGAGDDAILAGAGADSLLAGGGRDKLQGGDGNDTLVFAGDFTKADRAAGGEGFDTLVLTGGQADPIALTAKNMLSIESLRIVGAGYDLTMADGNVAAGATLRVDASEAQSLVFDGSHESDGAFNITGGFGPETLIGGAGDDHINARGGLATVMGGAGDDVLRGTGQAHEGLKFVGGEGADTLTGSKASADRYFFLDVHDSTAEASDLITLLDKHDTVWLKPIDADVTTAGDQAFHLVGAFSGQAGELVVAYDSFRDLTSISGDVDGDGQADLVILASGGHSGFTSFVL